MIHLPRGETVCFSQVTPDRVIAAATRVDHGSVSIWVGHDGVLTWQRDPQPTVYLLPSNDR
jgi:hypothetical protein